MIKLIPRTIKIKRFDFIKVGKIIYVIFEKILKVEIIRLIKGLILKINR